MSLDLLRIECKLDLILHALKELDPVLRALIGEGDALARYGTDLCPLCEAPIALTLDVEHETIRRDCACRPPVPAVSGISKLLASSTSSPSRVAHLQPHEDIADVLEDPAPTTTSSTPTRGTP